MNHAVSSYIEALPDPQQRIAEKLRELIFLHCPMVEERFSFKLPFYHLHGSMFCYINTVKNGIELCFCRGKHLVLAFPELELKDRVLIAGITLQNSQQIVNEGIAGIIIGAAEFQFDFFVEKKQKAKKKRPKN